MPKIKIEYRKLNNNAILPTRGSDFAAGYDLYACLDSPAVIQPGETVKIPTGLSIALPKSVFGAIYARSGLATKQGLRPANCVGVCDSDYRGEYLIALHNDSDTSRTIQHGDRIAQLVIQRYYPVEFIESDLSATQRGAGGFGSTGN